MINSISSNQKKLQITNWDKTINFSKYFFSFREAMHKWTKEISISGFIIGFSHFCSIVKAARGTNYLIIQNWAILTDYEWDFGKMNWCKITTLDMKFSGEELLSNWMEKINRLLNILTGIDLWENLRNSLQKINLYYLDTNADLNKLKDQLLKYPRLKHIEIQIKLF